MDTEKLAAATVVKVYADKFLAVLERIALALESGTIAAPQAASAAPVMAAAPQAPVAAAPPEVSTATYDEVRKAVMAFQDAKGVHAASNVLKSFGAQYIMDLKAHPEKFADVLAALK